MCGCVHVEVICDSLNVTGPNKLIGGGSIRRCWRKFVIVRTGSEVSYAHVKPNSVYFLLPVDQDVGLSALSPTSCLPIHLHVLP